MSCLGCRLRPRTSATEGGQATAGHFMRQEWEEGWRMREGKWKKREGENEGEIKGGESEEHEEPARGRNPRTQWEVEIFHFIFIDH